MTTPIETQERFVEAGGVRLRAVVDEPRGAGQGAASVLVLHGFTGCAESMDGVAASLSQQHRVARLDLVGHGRSDLPDAVDAYRMETCAEQILAAVDRLDLGRPHLLGYSMGGRAAIAAAVMAPERFASLVLVGATAGIGDPALRRERIASDAALADRIERDGVEAFVDEWMALPIFASQARLGAPALERARRQRLRNRARGLAQSLRGMGAGAQPPLFDRLDRYRGPVLIVVGEEDAKFRAIARDLQARFPDARTEVLANAGHAAHLEAPDAFAEVVSDFLARSAATAPSARIAAPAVGTAGLGHRA